MRVGKSIYGLSIVPFKEKQRFVQGDLCSREICLGYLAVYKFDSPG